MQFQIVDTEGAYRRLLAAPDAAAREAIFKTALIEPFSGLVRFFGGDGLATFAQWGMSPEQFAGGQADKMGKVIEALAAHDAWSQAAQALEEGRAAFAPYQDRLRLDTVVFGLLVADMSNAPWARGYTGFGGFPGWIMTVYGEPDEYNLARVKAATVHELHHNILGSTQPGILIASLGQYMVGEGLAESFATELYGADMAGPWVTEFDGSRLDETKALFKAALGITDFNAMRRYIFGDPVTADMGQGEGVGVPLYAGYALGYRVVQAYLRRTGQSVIEATFVPAAEIIERSEFFA